MWPRHTIMVAPLGAYDAILFIDTITPTPAPSNRAEWRTPQSLRRRPLSVT